eukprot:58041_1
MATSFVLCHTSLIIFFICCIISHASVFNCDSESLCSSVNHCASNEPCLITCDGTRACEDKTFHCPSQDKCVINCGTNITQKYSCHQTLFTTKSDTTLINITTKGFYSMAESTVFCPANTTPGFSGNCFIYSLEGKSQISNINIYAIESYHDIYIHCNEHNCYDPAHYPTMFCSDDYTPSCKLKLQSFSHNIWTCTVHTTTCDTISFESNHLPTSIPTTSSSFISTISTQYLWNELDGPPVSILSRKNDVAILLGGILGAAFCCSFILLFVVAAYLMKTKAEKFKSLIIVDAYTGTRKERKRLETESRTRTGTTSTESRTSVSDSRFAKKRKVPNLPKPKPRYKHLRQIKEQTEEPVEDIMEVSQEERSTVVSMIAGNTDTERVVVRRQTHYTSSKVPKHFSSNQLTQVDFDEIAKSLD